MACESAETQSPDAVLFAACVAARAAVAARNFEAGQGEPGERLAALSGLERLALDAIA